MTFTFQDKPLPSDILATSQGDIRGNYDYLQGVLGGISPVVKDHQVKFGNNTGTLAEGRHNSIGFIDLGIQNFPTDGITDLMYATAGNIFYKTIANLPIQLTNSGVGAPVTGTTANTTNAFTFLPGNFILQWGRSTVAQPDGATVLFPKTFTNILALLVSHSSTAPAETTQTIVSGASMTVSQFILRVSGAGSSSFSYVAIGN
jgi:hypothetical protein